MSDIGYYRYKVNDLPEGEHVFNWIINGEVGCTAKVIVKKNCPEFKYLKYMDTNGFYRFFPFNERWQQTDRTTLIGQTNNIVLSLKDSAGQKKNVGYKNTRVLSLVAENVSTEELEILTDIYSSPRVYLNNGDKDDWILVTLKGDGVTRRRKKYFDKFTVTIELPERYAITTV
jgi:hypothetical protein